MKDTGHVSGCGRDKVSILSRYFSHVRSLIFGLRTLSKYRYSKRVRSNLLLTTRCLHRRGQAVVQAPDAPPGAPARIAVRAPLMAEGIELFKLYQRKSASGRTWFSGRLGGARVVVLKADNATVDGDTVAVWTVLLRHRDPDRVNNRNDQQRQSTAKPVAERPPARAKARPASAPRSLPIATQRAVDGINNRYANPLNDDISDL
jgi:hypothetical protein